MRTLLLVTALLGSALAQDGNLIDLAPPGDREFVLDEAGMLGEAERLRISSICDKLLTETATPIIVVTIDKMSDHSGGGLRIETFATLLFDQWAIGHPELNGETWNTGILLLVSEGDRKARIELGAGWGHEKDGLCKQIMDEQIVSRFKQGDFPAGIVAGVEALDLMARDKPLPARPLDMKKVLIVVAFFGLLIFTVVSLIRRGSSGWAWLLWGAVFAILGMLLMNMLTRRGSGGGGFSGGSFGGGFSGGGGATGSW